VAVYSIEVASVVLASTGAHTLYTVPTGKVLILRDVRVWSGAGSANAIALWATGTVTVAFFGWSLGSGTWGSWEGRVVLPASRQLRINIGGQPVHCQASGYLLDA
jgi:hypothetical protein